MTPLALVDQIRSLPRDARLRFYRSLQAGTLAAARYRHDFWARPEQALPLLDQLATIEVITGGRRSGKTWMAAQLFNRGIFEGRFKRPRIIAATDAAVEETVVEGPSGLRTWLPPHLKPTFTATRGHAGVLVYPNGVKVVCGSAQRPAQAIGQGFDGTFADDPAGWIESCGEPRASETWKQALVSNSEGTPCMIVPTTRRGATFLGRVLTPGEMKGVHITRIGGTRANTSLAPSFIRDTVEELEGSDWAAEELEDEDRGETVGALWRREWLDAHRVRVLPELVRIVVAVDPADDDKKDSDETGIVVVGLGADARVYVMADYTGRHDATVWPAIAAWAFQHFEADALVCEANHAPAMVRRCMAIEAPNVPVETVIATRSKATRAEPVAMLYKAGRVSHLIDGPQLSRPGPVRICVPIFDPATGRRDPVDLLVARDKRRWTTLENELCGWRQRGRSPNGIDALTWGVWYLAPPDGAPVATTAAAMARSEAFAGRYADVDPRRPAYTIRRPNRW